MRRAIATAGTSPTTPPAIAPLSDEEAEPPPGLDGDALEEMIEGGGGDDDEDEVGLAVALK